MAHTTIPIFPLPPSPLGYGTDPNLVAPVVPWAFTLTPVERDLIGLLSDIILPGTQDQPAPSAAGVAEFFDEWLSAPYPQQETDRELVKNGLILIERMAEEKFAKPFAELSELQKAAIVTDIASAGPSDCQFEIKVQFFRRFRYLLLGAYFTSSIGPKAIGYIGNVPLNSFPRVSDEVVEKIEIELRKLGLALSL